VLFTVSWQWEDRMQKGLFRYDVTACETKVGFVFPFLNVVFLSIDMVGMIYECDVFCRC